ncbi:E3 SUMO-protein ligase ZBED1 [Frankliniella fusca]|uniref:E3 SUMO-protein ligase ZBED1 n=1 Tax=Frankliniella fusca TaxID=407009 RepID=A0AAE1LRL7_9NEOP|nr:E3 SUMO-protein ligase ZBED1 [Frankliniella fusca]
MPSPVWGEWFTKVKGKDGKTKAQCQKCPTQFAFHSCTSNLFTHIKSVHGVDLKPTPPKGGGRKKRSFHSFEGEEDIDGDLSPPAAKEPRTSTTECETPGTPTSKTTRPSPSTSPLQRCVNNIGSFSAGGTRDSMCNNALMYMMMKDGLPLDTPEKKGFRLFVRTLQPLYKAPSEPTLTRMLEEKYNYLRGVVGAMLAEARHITLTADIWTQKGTMKSFLGVTAHFCKGPLTYAFELGARFLMERKTTENLRVAFRSFCEDWKIEYDNVRLVVTDGGANIKAAVKAEFGPGKHLSCMSHQFNNIGQKIIGNEPLPVPSERVTPTAPAPAAEEEDEDPDEEVLEAEAAAAGPGTIREVMVKVKKIVRFFRQSEVATSKLTELQQTEQGLKEGQCIKLIQEVRTRWNSGFDMLERFLKLAPLVSRVLLDLQRKRVSKARPPDMVTVEEEDILKEVKELLAPLARATKELSGDKTVTLSKCIPVVRNLRRDTEKFSPTTPLSFNMKQDLLNLLNKSFGLIEEVKLYTTATLLDPRFKKVAFYQDQLTQRRVYDAVVHLGQLVKARMRASATAAADALTEQAAAAGDNQAERPVDDFWGDFDQEVQQQAATARPGEDAGNGIPVQLQMYLSTPPVSRVDNPNPLQSWECLKNEYKDVYAVAQEYLSLLATSVPSERMFSHAGNIANNLRNRLTGKHLEMFVFLSSCSEELWFAPKKK